MFRVGCTSLYIPFQEGHRHTGSCPEEFGQDVRGKGRHWNGSEPDQTQVSREARQLFSERQDARLLDGWTDQQRKPQRDRFQLR